MAENKQFGNSEQLDAVSRATAINKFEPWLKVDGYSEGELNMLKAVLYELRVMPSAQPEIIRCKDCMHNGSFDTDCPIKWNGKEYCSFAERRTDE